MVQPTVQSPMTIPYVQAKIKQFEKRFNALKRSTRECLQRVPVKRVADALTSLPADEMDEHKMFLRDNLSALYNATDHFELFGTMNFHWNYQNPQLLDHLIQEFHLEGIKDEMKSYKEDLQQFRKKTPLKLFCQSHRKKHVKPQPEFHELVAEFDWPDHVTLEVVEEFRQEYADHYSLRECAMMLNKVLPGSFIVTWFIPGSIVEKLKVKLPFSTLKKHTVTKLEIAGECVYPEVMKEMSPATKSSSDDPSTPPAAGATAATTRAASHQTSEETTVASKKQEPSDYSFYSELNGEYHFVEEPSKDCFCPVTFGVLLQPHLTECCGKHLSEEAATRIQGEGKACPMCKNPHLNTMLDKWFRREINELQVFCNHQNRGCEWQGELSNLEHHVQSCPMKTAPLVTSGTTTTCQLEEEKWFFKSLSRAEAEDILKKEGKEGGFVVRNSSKENMYALSVCYKGHVTQVRHYLIKHEGSKYYIFDKLRFKSVKEMIEYHKLKRGGLVARLFDIFEERWNINKAHLILGRELGNGQFARVVAGKWKGKIDVAVKMMKDGAINVDGFIEEAKTMIKFEHENLVRVYGVCASEGPLFIVMELMSKGSLLQYIQYHSQLVEKNETILDIALQICSAMQYLEHNGFVHRDLAARNCFIGDENVIKVADFGLAQFIADDEYTSSKGSKFPIKWASPEVITHAKFSSKSDVWSFGILMWELWSGGKTPYLTFTNRRVINEVLMGYRLKKPRHCDLEVYEIMQECWSVKADDRPAFTAICTSLHHHLHHSRLSKLKYSDSDYDNELLSLTFSPL